MSKQVSRVVVLAYDLGSDTGWARFSGLRPSPVGAGIADTKPDRIFSGVHDLRIREKEGEHPGARWRRVRELFLDQINQARASEALLGPSAGDVVVAWERVVSIGGSSRANVALYGLEAQLVEATYETGVKVYTVMPSTLKKFATGKGNCKKPDMIAGARAKWPGQDCLKDDHADALWVGDWAWNQLAVPKAN